MCALDDDLGKSLALGTSGSCLHEAPLSCDALLHGAQRNVRVRLCLCARRSSGCVARASPVGEGRLGWSIADLRPEGASASPFLIDTASPFWRTELFLKALPRGRYKIRFLRGAICSNVFLPRGRYKSILLGASFPDNPCLAVDTRSMSRRAELFSTISAARSIQDEFLGEEIDLATTARQIFQGEILARQEIDLASIMRAGHLTKRSGLQSIHVVSTARQGH